MRLLTRILLFYVLATSTLFGYSQFTPRITQQPDGSLLLNNGLVGVVVPTEKNAMQNGKALAPLQAFMFQDGNLSDPSQNFLQVAAPLQSVKVEKQPSADRFNYQIYYTFKGGTYYRCIITVIKNSKTIQVLEDSNDDVSYSVQINHKHAFDQARYRGWSASSPEYGKEPDGRQYRDENNRSPVDAVLDLRFDLPTKYMLMSNWDPAGGEVNTGRYWQVYKKTGKLEDPMFGIFQGKPSLLIGNKFVGVRFMSSPDPKQASGILELKMELERRGPDNSYVARKRFQWCAFLTTKKDLGTPEQYQAIGREMNLQSGVAARVDAYRTAPLLLNPAFRKGAIYLEEKEVSQLIDRVKKDKLFYEYLISVNPSFKSALDAWRFPDSAASLKRSILQMYSGIQKELISGDGTHAFNLKYWMGSMNYKNTAMLITSLFADDKISLTETEKNQMEEFLRLMARLLWDNDYVPFFDSSGINFGTANMNYQYRNNGRNFFALLFSKDPEFSQRAARVLEETRKDLSTAISPNGISFASPHYTQATIDPILYTMLQLRNAQMGDLFRENSALLEKFICFYTSLLTPRSVRFMGHRKLVSIGDGSEESAASFALLGAGFKGINDSLSQDLYYIFEHGAPRPSAFGSLGLSVDLLPHKGKVMTGSSNFPGYLSHARSGLNTPYESAAWIINGETYLDHRNDDRGEVILYALGAPLSLSRSSFYSPHIPDARMRSMVIPEQLFPVWKADKPSMPTPASVGTVWKYSSSTSYSKFPQLVQSESLMTNGSLHWTRRFMMIHAKAEEPIIVFYDSLSTKEPAVWSMSFMAESVLAPGNSFIKIPSIKYDPGSNFSIPPGTPEKSLGAGWNKFYFLGQQWREHAGKGINWWLHLYNPGNSSYSFSEWTTTWQNTQETVEYKQSNDKPYSETQQMIRWRSVQPFFAVITPFNKNDSVNAVKTIAQAKNQLVLRRGSRTYQLTPWQLDIQDEKTRTIYFLGQQQGRIEEFSSSGGPVALQMDGNLIRIIVTGNKGAREIEIPFELVAQSKDAPVPQLSKGKSILNISFEGNETVYPNDNGYIEYAYKRK